MDTQESCLDSVKNKMLGNEVEEWSASDQKIYIYIYIYGYMRNDMFVTFLQQIISDRLLFVGKKVIFMIDLIMIS